MRARDQLLTLLGWTPRLRAFMRSRVLDCGCVVGTYDTWTREPIELVDWRSDGCTNEEHREGAVLQA